MSLFRGFVGVVDGGLEVGESILVEVHYILKILLVDFWVEMGIHLLLFVNLVVHYLI